LPPELIGDGEHPPKPIRDFKALYDDLDKRIGFGGVAGVRHHGPLGQNF
jgi:hypothetical protein